MILEITVDSLISALLAQEGGADRLELCDNFAQGGTTPSKGALEIARERIHCALFTMIRPRGGDFLYTDHEYAIMKRDINVAREAGADGVVFGMLSSDGTIDKQRTSELVVLSKPMQVTFHRAFDLTEDPYAALEDIIEAGADRILTSGQAPTALEGAFLIAALVKKAAGRIIIMPGAGVNEDTISELLAITGASEFHASLRAKTVSAMKFRRDGISMGSCGFSEYLSEMASPGRIARCKSILGSHTANKSES